MVPSRWISAQSHPIPKFAAPRSHTDFRPVSVTPVLNRLVEKHVVRQFFYTLRSLTPRMAFGQQPIEIVLRKSSVEECTSASVPQCSAIVSRFLTKQVMSKE